ncbi:nuclear transport factor 2 family protein [Bradyrhizobium barranii subsp. apii]|nr:nuclear transport factor 2 family protein [Bradyrhizobium barranii subsp. apii]
MASIISVLSRMHDASMRNTYQCSPDRAMTHRHDRHATLDKVARGCNTPRKIKKEETMTINRRDLALSTLAVSALALTPALAASADEEAVAKKVEAFRLAQIAADPKALGALCADEVSYSHSNGKVEDKATFVTNATDGKSKFLSIEYKDPTIKVVGPAAIVRFHWMGEQEMAADGKKVSTNLHILMNWQKQGDDWKLLSRAATKL